MSSQINPLVDRWGIYNSPGHFSVDILYILFTVCINTLQYSRIYFNALLQLLVDHRKKATYDCRRFNFPLLQAEGEVTDM